MKDITRELTDEEVKKAEEHGVYSLFDDWQLMGYGVYGAQVYEDKDGKKMLYYRTGDSCD